MATVGVRRVLVVDDDPTLRETLGEVLTDDGFDVRVAWNGRDALEKLDGWDADVVILDVMMPVMRAFPAVTVPPAARLGGRRRQHKRQQRGGKGTKQLLHGSCSAVDHSR